MTYLQFHGVFTLPVLFLLVGLNRRMLWQDRVKVVPGLAFLVFMALTYTTPWDNYLVYKTVWSYPAERVWFSILYVPFEEYLFFVLQTVITGVWTYFLYRRDDWHVDAISERSTVPRRVGTSISLVFAAVGFALMTEERFLYMGLILAWAMPVVALHWGYGGDWLWKRRKLYLMALLPPSLYLSFADRIAIADGIWSISERYTTGILVGGLPLEEGLFFTIANVLVVQGTLTYWWTWDLIHSGRFSIPQWVRWMFPVRVGS